jgi:hypothetical protein
MKPIQVQAYSGAEGYSAMTKALSRDPVALYSVLHARRKDLIKARQQALKDGNRVSARSLHLAVGQLDDALKKVVAHLNEIAAAEEEAPAEESMAEESMAEESMSEEVEAPLEEASADEDFAEQEPEDGAEAVSPEDAETDEVLEEEEPADEGKSSVAMKASLRRELGDVAADLLDGYATKIQESVVTFFENLTKKALDLGTADPSDSENSLREQLLAEIGRRGLEKVEPNFAEWRAGLIKQLMKDINKMFEVPSEPEPEAELEIPEGEPAEGEEASFEEAPEEEAPAEEAEVEEVEETEEPAEEAPAEPMKMPASVSAFTVAQPMSFTIHRDMKPGAVRSIKLT